jgi:lipoyl(octanoyl) transferase
MLHLQRALVYQAQEERANGALVLCEHQPLITVGREGSPGQVRFDPEELRALRWGLHWVNRGGGCWLHLPGQLAVYAVLSLSQHGIGVQGYVDRLQRVVIQLLKELRIQATVRMGYPGVWVGSRSIAEVGVAVRDWISCFGLVLNVNPDLGPYRRVRSGAGDGGPMTSVERERRGPLRPAFVRELFLEHFSAAFHFDRTALLFNHAILNHPSSTLRKTSRFQSA